MTKQVQIRRGINSKIAQFIGAEGELTFNKTTNRIHSHDGQTPGGFPHALVSDITTIVNNAVAQNSLMTANSFTTYTNTPNQVVDTFAIGAFRTAKYLIQATSGSTYYATEILVIHNGTTVFITEYATIDTGTPLIAAITADINNGNARLLISPINATTTINVIRTLVAI